jgi:hypothetical protein
MMLEGGIMFKEVTKRFQGQYTRIENKEQFDQAIKKLTEMFNQLGYIEIKVNTKKNRTLTQNAALHVYYRNLADALNDAGMDVRKTLKPSFYMMWTPNLVKELLWKPIQEALTGQKSTTKIERADPSKVYDVLHNKLTDWGIDVPFPSVESIGNYDYEYENKEV